MDTNTTATIAGDKSKESSKLQKLETFSQNHDNHKNEQKAKPRGLMTKLGKSDLLRLLSILEGELEAQDIFIADLQTRMQQDISSYAKKRYYHHSMTDPFHALMRDDIVTKERNSRNDDKVAIEPLPLLEKVVAECKRQQIKVRQHIALSDAYYKLVNTELVEVKRKYARDTAVGDDVTAALEKEREKLNLQIRVEQAKSRKAEMEYRNLLQAINTERQRFQIIITMLLEERNGRFSKCTDLDDVTLEEMKDKYKELMIQNEKLETQVKSAKENESKLKEEIDQLKNASRQTVHTSETVDSKTVNDSEAKSQVQNPTKELLPEVSSSSSNNVKSNCCSSKSLTTSSVTVALKRTPTVIEKKLISPRERYLAKANPQGSKTTDASKEVSRIPSHPDKINLRSSDLTLKLTSSGIVSSPTSGASNFALNSPNQPSSANTTFSSPVLPTKTKKIHVPSGSFQATRQKFQRFSTPKPCPPTTLKNELSHSTRHVKMGGDGVSSTDSPLPSVQANTKTDIKTGARKTLESSYKPQPPKPHRVGSAKTNKEEVKDKTNPPPLPPKKPNLFGKNQNNNKSLSVRCAKENDGKKSVSHTSTSDKLPRPTSANSKLSGGTSAKGTTNLHHSSNLHSKRPNSLNANTNNNSNSRAIARPSSAGNIYGRHALSAQQRLFPPQDGNVGQLLSPITNTVPKSPLESYPAYSYVT